MNNYFMFLNKKVVFSLLAVVIAACVSMPSSVIADGEDGWFDYGVSGGGFLGDPLFTGGSLKDDIWNDYGVSGGDIPWNDYGVSGGDIPWNDYGVSGGDIPWNDYGVSGGGTSWTDYGVSGGGYGGYGGYGGGYGQTYSGGGYRGFSGGGFTLTPPRYSSTPTYYYPPQPQPRPTPTSITNNSCTNNSCNNINNSINGSFNNTSTVTNINSIPTPYYPVVYQQPAPYCTITVSNYGGTYYGQYNQGATLTWSSTNATSAFISGVGTVSTYGTRVVYPTGGMVYTMTVTGPGGTANCQTQAIYYPTPTPIPTPVPLPQLSCVISASSNSVQSGQATYLAWSSTGATSAFLSDGIGAVAPAGSLRVMPNTSKNYVLTIYGAYGGSATCNVTIGVVGTSVSLTQIPYTGFDLGSFGNSIYWASMLAFAASLAYLALYFQGGVGAVFSGMNRTRVAFQPAVAQIQIPVAPVRAAAPQAPVVKREVVAPIQRAEFRTSDKMTMIPSEDGQAPRLIINRA